ncbi:MAG: hypothetical protein AAFV33_01115 [Chloroflexota bacterium]
MTTIVAQIAPQRSTQYTELVTDLAPYELLLSNIGDRMTGELAFTRLGTQTYLKFELDEAPDEAALRSLANMAMTDAYFQYYDSVGNEVGPFLKPIDVDTTTYLPVDLVSTRRYRGKTNELFTQFMCNIARYSSDFRDTPWNKLTLLDPLCGGGTTLFVGLVLGADVAGIENDRKVVEGTVGFIKQYMREAKIAAKFREDKLKGAGKRWFITLDQSLRCSVGRGETADVQQFITGLKRPQLIVTDLPYGIQHGEAWGEVLLDALPAWAEVLADGGTMAFSWNATRFSRAEMVDLVEAISDFTVLNDSPYNQLAHRVDRVIKERDVIVARR